ncbi:MAG TPA: hypothetical protein QF353_03160 [Gammaproteobacteria bacterium]|nr:hypothetical protein [Gammaproteobacteria bacterium]
MLRLISDSINALVLPFVMQNANSLGADFTQGGTDQHESLMYSFRIFMLYHARLTIPIIFSFQISWLAAIALTFFPALLQLSSKDQSLNIIDVLSTSIIFFPITSLFKFPQTMQYINRADVYFKSKIHSKVPEKIQQASTYIKENLFMFAFIPLVVITALYSLFNPMTLPLWCLLFANIVTLLNHCRLISNNYKENIFFNLWTASQLLYVTYASNKIELAVNLINSLQVLKTFLTKTVGKIKILFENSNNLMKFLNSALGPIRLYIEFMIILDLFEKVSDRYSDISDLFQNPADLGQLNEQIYSAIDGQTPIIEVLANCRNILLYPFSKTRTFISNKSDFLANVLNQITYVLVQLELAIWSICDFALSNIANLLTVIKEVTLILILGEKTLTNSLQIVWSNKTKALLFFTSMAAPWAYFIMNPILPVYQLVSLSFLPPIILGLVSVGLVPTRELLKQKAGSFKSVVINRLKQAKERLSGPYTYGFYLFIKTLYTYVMSRVSTFTKSTNSFPTNLDVSTAIPHDILEIDVPNMSGKIINDGYENPEYQETSDFPKELLMTTIDRFKQLVDNNQEYKDGFYKHLKSDVKNRNKELIDLDDPNAAELFIQEIEQKIRATSETNTEVFKQKVAIVLRRVLGQYDNSNITEKKRERDFYIATRSILRELHWCIPRAHNGINTILRDQEGRSARGKIESALFLHRRTFFQQITANSLVRELLSSILRQGYRQGYRGLSKLMEQPLYKELIPLIASYASTTGLVKISLEGIHISDKIQTIIKSYKIIVEDHQQLNSDQENKFLSCASTLGDGVAFYSAASLIAMLVSSIATSEDNDIHYETLKDIALGQELGIMKASELQNTLNTQALQQLNIYSGLSFSYQEATPIENLKEVIRETWPESDDILKALNKTEQNKEERTLNEEELIRDKNDIVDMLTEQLKLNNNKITPEEIEQLSIAYLCGTKHSADFIKYILEFICFYPKDIIKKLFNKTLTVESQEIEQLLIPSQELNLMKNKVVNHKAIEKMNLRRLADKQRPLPLTQDEYSTICLNIGKLEAEAEKNKKTAISNALNELYQDVDKLTKISITAQELVPTLALLSHQAIAPKENKVVFATKTTHWQSIKEKAGIIPAFVEALIITPIWFVVKEHINLVKEILSMPILHKAACLLSMMMSCFLILNPISDSIFLISQLMLAGLLFESWNQSQQANTWHGKLLNFFWHPTPLSFMQNKYQSIKTGKTPWYTSLSNLALAALPTPTKAIYLAKLLPAFAVSTTAIITTECCADNIKKPTKEDYSLPH